jgi:NADH:ubiquinone oxidoreductase subunit 2 (subunit N)
MPFWLVVAALGLSPVGFYYYLRALKLAWVVAENSAPASVASEGDPVAVAGRPIETAVTLLAAAGVLLLGVFPEWLLGPLRAAIQQAGW